MNVTCSAPVCPVILNSSCVFYEGESLIYTGINTNDSLQVALQKIDAALGLTTVVNIYNSDGVLTGNRTVSMNSFSLSFEKDVFIYNARVGRGAGAIITNAVLGVDALSSNTTGAFNTAVGSYALDGNTSGDSNTAIGSYALTNSTTATGNVGVGTSALTTSTTGYSNTAIGFGALYDLTTGYENVAIGRSAFVNLTTGIKNVGVGLSAGSSITTGSNNTIIGWGSGQAITTGDNNTIIGANVLALAPTTSNNIIIADGAGNIQIRDDGANTILPRLAGIGTRLVVTNATGALSTQPIPTGNITGTGANGQVAYWTGASTQTGSNNLFWDNAQGRLGIGINTPTQRLDVSGSVYVLGENNTTAFVVRPNALASSAYNTFEVQTTAGAVQFAINRNGPVVSAGQITIAGQNIYRAGDILFRTSAPADNGIIGQTSQETGSATLGFTSSLSRKFTFSHGVYALGNTILGTATADAGQRLQVYGDTLLRGSGNTSATTALTVQNSSSQNILRVLNNGELRVGNGQFLYVFPYSTVYDTIDINGSNFSIYPSQGSISLGGGSQTTTSGNANNVITKGRFFPLSGTATFTDIRCEPLINQTGGANGITRGLYVNPNLSAAADWRSIEWSNNTGWGLYGAGTANNLLNGRLYIPAGSYDLPSLSFVNDTNTGLFSPLADNIELKTGTNNAVVLENQGVNIMQYSENLGTFSTNTQNIGVGIPGGVAAPDGTLTANIAVPDTSLNQHRFFRTYSTTSPFTMSVYAKAAGYNFISLGWSGGVNGDAIIFDLVNGTISGSAPQHTASIENVGNGWFRCSITYITPFTSANYSRWIIVRNANSTANYSGDGTSGVYVWGWQIEENTASTSYIKTGATAVTRPQAISLLGQNLYGNAITRRVTGPSLNDLSLATDFTDRLTVKSTSGNILVNTATDVASSILTVESTTKGFLPPRMTVAQRTAIASPAEGLIVFQTDGVIGLYVYANAAWRSLTMV